MTQGARIGPVPQEPALYNIDVEQELIGAVLMNNAAWYELGGRIDAADFFPDHHQTIWSAMGEDIRAGRVANPFTLKTRLAALDPDLARAGLVSVGDYLGRLAANSSSIVSVGDYADLIRDLADRRRIVLAAREAIALAMDTAGPPAAEIMAQAVGTIERSVSLSGRRGPERFSAVLDRTLGEIQSAIDGGDGAMIPTGLAALDRVFDGFERGGLYVLAGRPGMGKSAVAAGIAGAVARTTDPATGKTRRTLLVTLEMRATQMVVRMLAAEQGIAYQRLRRGRLSAAERDAFPVLDAGFRDMTLWLDQERGQTLDHMRSTIRRLQVRYGIDLVIVDYLQIIRPDTAYRGNKVAEVTAISNGLKEMAGQCDVPILALAQLNRQVESREDKRPQLSDLRESGAIEQDADAVMLLYRQGYYDHRDDNERRNAPDWLEINIAKQRMGPPGVAELWFDPALNRLSDGPAAEAGGLV